MVPAQALPVDPTVVRDVRLLRKVESGWDTLLDPHRCYRFVYALQVRQGEPGSGTPGVGEGLSRALMRAIAEAFMARVERVFVGPLRTWPEILPSYPALRRAGPKPPLKSQSLWT